LEHRRAKQRYTRTNKNHFVKQLAKHDTRERVLRAVAARLAAHEYREKKRSHYRERKKRRPRTARMPHEPTAQYHIAEEAAEKTDITVWLREHIEDPATKVRLIK
jgi:hypothetical protein